MFLADRPSEVQEDKWNVPALYKCPSCDLNPNIDILEVLFKKLQKAIEED